MISYQHITDIYSKTFLVNFDVTFEHIKRKKIAIYGLGSNTHILTRYIKGFSIVGLLDKDKASIGKEINGYPVLSMATISTCVDAIIIVSNDSYWSIIFDRIKAVSEQFNIDVFYQDGSQPIDEVNENNIKNNPYWRVDKELLLERLSSYDIITFDLFDTLVMRKVLRPEDVFSLVEKKLFQLYKKGYEFAEIRKFAATQLDMRVGPIYSFDDIYTILVKDFKFPKGLVYLTQQLEIETELDFLTPREEILGFFNYAKEQGKTVSIVTDMYYGIEIIAQILKNNGIAEYSDIYISCETKKAKKDGVFWKYFSQIYDVNRVLHIGDDFVSDQKYPSHYGIASFAILSGYEMLKISSIKALASQVCTIEDSMLVGVLVSHLFNSPFALAHSEGKFIFRSFKTFGYVCFGPVIYRYLLWLISESKQNKTKEILFFARDGFLLKKFYTQMIDSLNIVDMPEGIYFKTSRRTVTVASIKTKGDIYKLAKLSFSGTLSQFLNKRFGINAQNDDLQNDIEINTKLDGLLINCYLEKYEEAILENSLVERCNYLSYISSLNLQAQKKVVVSDIYLNGTNQYYLSKITGKSYQGYYFCAKMGSENPYDLGEGILGIYQGRDNSLTAKNSHIMKQQLIIEAVLAAPEGMYIRCDESGEFEQAPIAQNQKNYYKKIGIHEGIEEFISDMNSLYDNPFESLVSSDLVDEVLGLFLSKKCIIHTSIKKTLYAEDAFSFVKDVSIWDD